MLSTVEYPNGKNYRFLKALWDCFQSQELVECIDKAGFELMSSVVYEFR